MTVISNTLRALYENKVNSGETGTNTTESATAYKTWEDYYNNFKSDQTEAELNEQIKKLEIMRKNEAKKLGLPETATWEEIKKASVEKLKNESKKPIEKEEPKWA